MIFQLEVYYGAMLNGRAIYTLKNSLENCTKFPHELDKYESHFKNLITENIKKNGFDPNDFEFGFLTKEQYENRLGKENENSQSFTVTR